MYNSINVSTSNEKYPTYITTPTMKLEIFSDKLLSIESYEEGYNKSPQKFRQDYDKLLYFSKKLIVN